MAESVSSTSASLLVRVRDLGNSDAWQEFNLVYAPLISSYCRLRGVKPADTADISQNVIVRVMKAIQTFEYQPEKGRFRDWLGTITRNEIFRYIRKLSKEPTATDIAYVIDVVTEDPEWSEAFTIHVVRVACDKISREFEPSTWQAFESTWFRNEPTHEVADRLGLTLQAVYVAKSRVAGRLRAEIVRLAEDVPK